jgi:hypothetical protein
MRATITTFTTIAIATTAWVGTAAADGGYFEGVAGVSVPFGDDDWDRFSDESLKFGIRAGGGAGPTALELTGDVSFINTDPDIEQFIPGDFGAQQFRLLVGARHQIKAGNALVFFRAGAGLDVFHYGTSGTFLGVDFEQSETDPGIAAEVGGGFAIAVGPKLYVGGQVAVPMAFHFDDDDPDDNNDADLEYNAYDVDLLFTIGTRQ